MVEIVDEKSQERDRLRRRCEKLSRELDDLEASYKEAAGVFRNVIAALCELGQCQFNQESGQALDDLQTVLAGANFNPAQVSGALVTFRTALLNQPMDHQPAPGGGDSGRHVALSILTGLHLGDPEFDQRLEAAIGEVSGCIKNDEVKPAIALVEDLLARYRESVDRRRGKAVKAMQEVLAELMRTEDELAEAFEHAASRLSEEGQKHEESVNASMGSLARQIGSADNLDQLKSSVLDHIRYLRKEIKSKRHKERQLLSSTQDELLKRGPGGHPGAHGAHGAAKPAPEPGGLHRSSDQGVEQAGPQPAAR